MFKLSIVSPERTLFEDDIKSLVIPGGEGYLGVLSNHAPLISTLQVGKVTIIDKDEKQFNLATSGGFIEVSNNKATILADTVEFADEIDTSRAQDKLDRAMELINLPNSSRAERERAMHSRAKAKNRLDIANDK